MAVLQFIQTFTSGRPAKNLAALLRRSFTLWQIPIDTDASYPQSGPMLVLLLVLMQTSDAALAERFLDLEDLLITGLREKDAAQLEILLADDYVMRGRPDIDRASA
jgi:hypothetical protein